MLCLGLCHVPSSLTCHVYFMLCSILKIFLSFVWVLFSHSSCTLHVSSSTLVYIFFFFSLLPFDSFVYSWQKGREYTRLYRHFYMTHVRILRKRNSTSCTFVGGESHRGDAYTKGENKSFYEKTLLCLLYIMLVFSLLYGTLSYV